VLRFGLFGHWPLATFLTAVLLLPGARTRFSLFALFHGGSSGHQGHQRLPWGPLGSDGQPQFQSPRTTRIYSNAHNAQHRTPLFVAFNQRDYLYTHCRHLTLTRAPRIHSDTQQAPNSISFTLCIASIVRK
jgi:hypothetical protein